MEVFALILLLLAYTLGVAILVVQIICYIRKIEYPETIALVISFLLLLLTSAVLEFEYISDRAVQDYTQAASNFSQSCWLSPSR
jgi:hypothetical protein